MRIVERVLAGQASGPIRRFYDLAEPCVFSKQSPGPILCDPLQLPEQVGSPKKAPLIPKLRGQFAEFLNEGSH